MNQALNDAKQTKSVANFCLFGSVISSDQLAVVRIWRCGHVGLARSCDLLTMSVIPSMIAAETKTVIQQLRSTLLG